MKTKVYLECPGVESQAFDLEHANRLFKLQGNDPKGWKIKADQKFELNENGVIIKRSNKTNSRSGKQGPDSQSH